MGRVRVAAAALKSLRRPVPEAADTGRSVEFAGQVIEGARPGWELDGARVVENPRTMIAGQWQTRPTHGRKSRSR
jgi:hypothetical protein